MLRSILHCDMNNFYASVECMLDPALKKYPIAVCGSVEERHGIVLAKNYKAKAFDVKTGDAVWQAKQKCKDLVVVPPHYEEYKKQFEIPLYEKPFLSIEEASVYTGIGRDKLYELTNPEDCPFVLWIGNRRMIKRRVFDEYIEKCYSI